MMIVTIANPLEWDDVEPAANDDDEIVELEVDFTDHCGRVLACTVLWDAALHEAEMVTAWDENGQKVECDTDTRDAIVRKALA